MTEQKIPNSKNLYKP